MTPTVRNVIVGRRLNLLQNGGFDVDAYWAKAAGVTISGGTANWATAGSGGISQAVSLSAGGIYLVTFSVTAYTSGSIIPRFTGGTTVNATTRTAAGDYTDTLTAVAGNITFAMQGSGAGTFSIDNVSLRRLS